MEVAWFSPKLFKAVILNGAGCKELKFQFRGRGLSGAREWEEHGSKMYLIVQSSFVYEKQICCFYNKK